MHILVTGASGQIGGRVLAQLRQAGHTVRALGRTRPPESDMTSRDEFVRRDLRLPESLRSTDFEGCDATVWMAVERSAASSMRAVNVDSVRTACQLAQDVTSDHCFILFSSVSVYGTSRTRVVDESSETIDPFALDTSSYWVDDALRRYGQTKLQGELALASAVRSARAVVLRPTVILSNDRFPNRPASAITRLLWAERTTHFISASDVGRATVRVLERRDALPPATVTTLNVLDPAGERMRYADAWGAPSERGLPLAALRLIDWARYSRRPPLRFPLATQQFTSSHPLAPSVD